MSEITTTAPLAELASAINAEHAATLAEAIGHAPRGYLADLKFGEFLRRVRAGEIRGRA